MSINKNKKDEIFHEYLNQLYTNQIRDITSYKNKPEKLIENFNKSIEEKNAEQKHEFRNKLLKLVSKLIKLQLIFFNIIVLVVVSSVVFKFDWFKSNIPTDILDFLKYYISVTVVELLGMLWFVMKYVFIDTDKKSKNLIHKN